MSDGQEPFLTVTLLSHTNHESALERATQLARVHFGSRLFGIYADHLAPLDRGAGYSPWSGSVRFKEIPYRTVPSRHQVAGPPPDGW